jgi:large subunit ribosomal protein L22
VRRADEVLQFTTRDVAKDVRKVLASAGRQRRAQRRPGRRGAVRAGLLRRRGPDAAPVPPACPRPATRIRKRTCHITIVVARLSDQRLEVLQNRQQAQTAAGRRRAGTTAQSRRDRVARSRARAEGLREAQAERAVE